MYYKLWHISNITCMRKGSFLVNTRVRLFSIGIEIPHLVEGTFYVSHPLKASDTIYMSCC